MKENEERELSPPLEQLIDQMANTVEADGSTDEGYEAADEGPEDEDGEKRGLSAIRSYQDVMKVKPQSLSVCLCVSVILGDSAFDSLAVWPLLSHSSWPFVGCVRCSLSSCRLSLPGHDAVSWLLHFLSGINGISKWLCTEDRTVP